MDNPAEEEVSAAPEEGLTPASGTGAEESAPTGESEERRSDDQEAAIEEAFEEGTLPEADRRISDLLDRLELPAGSSIEFGQNDVRATVKTDGAHPTYVHGKTLRDVAEQL
jgi:hypothetical protein